MTSESPKSYLATVIPALRPGTSATAPSTPRRQVGHCVSDARSRPICKLLIEESGYYTVVQQANEKGNDHGHSFVRSLSVDFIWCRVRASPVVDCGCSNCDCVGRYLRPGPRRTQVNPSLGDWRAYPRSAPFPQRVEGGYRPTSEGGHSTVAVAKREGFGPLVPRHDVSPSGLISRPYFLATRARRSMPRAAGHLPNPFLAVVWRASSSSIATKSKSEEQDARNSDIEAPRSVLIDEWLNLSGLQVVADWN